MPAQMPLTVVSSGVVCSLGLSAPAALAAIRASLDNFKETEFIDDLGFPIVGAAIPSGALDLPEEAAGFRVGGDARLARMFVLAATECLRAAGGADIARTPVLLLGPESPRLASSPDRMQRRLAVFERALGRPLHPESSFTRSGSPGLVEALFRARELLSSTAIPAVLVAGADSFLNPGDINDALSDERLLTSGCSDGFIPGEAAACLLVTRGPGKDARSAGALTITGLGSADESETRQADLCSRGVGLASAIRKALDEAGLPAHAMHARYTDISAEPYFFEESSYAWTRVLRRPSPPGYKMFTPVTRVGHVGCAMGPLLLAIVLDEARRGRAAGPNTLVHLSSSGAARGALLAVAS